MHGKREISIEEAASNGVTTAHHEMDNGELRYRLINSDTTIYIRTESVLNPRSPKECWQRSHYHKGVKETYIVQRGEMALVELRGGDTLQFRVFGVNGTVMTEPPIPHNVFMFPGSIIHTVKHGHEGDRKSWTEMERSRTQDRHPHPLLDTVTIDIPLTETDLRRLDGRFIHLTKLNASEIDL